MLWDCLDLERKRKKKDPACACQCGCPTTEADVSRLAKEMSGTVRILTIKVLGAGCASCHTLLENTQIAVASLGLGVEVEYVTDMARIAGYGVMSVPALVVNENIVTMGKVLKPEEVAAILKNIQG